MSQTALDLVWQMFGKLQKSSDAETKPHSNKIAHFLG